MFVAMNRFFVNSDRAEEFATAWKTRESFLHEMDGFIDFQLLQGADKDGTTIFISKVNWQNESNFKVWVESEQFKSAHGKKRMPEGVLQGHPHFESYTVIDQK
jgi:heme-degrading monooxygenase HmoA